MADEYTRPPYSRKMPIPNEYAWDTLTSKSHTLKKNPLKLEDLRDFITLYKPSNRHKRTEIYHAENNPEGKWRKFSYEEIIARNQTS